MSDHSDPSAQLNVSWDLNAQAWTRIVREQGIESRRVATDAAIVDAVVGLSPRSILDVGCGEGWLCRAAEARGIRAVGIDGSPALIEAARQAGGADAYHHLRYSQFARLPTLLGGETFDVAVCNFSLLDADIQVVLRCVAGALPVGGRLVIQTTHPLGDERYVDGWRREDFAAFSAAFPEPMPWYFRTLGSWSAEMGKAGLVIERLIEPRRPEGGLPVSLIIVAMTSGGPPHEG